MITKKLTQLTIIILFLVTNVYTDTAIVTYHLYTKYDKLTTVSCSDGANGLMSWGYKDLSMMFPYVTAWQPASWNSPQCGSCAKIMWKGKYTYVTVIDQCGMINSAYSHFDMSKEAFLGLFGQEGYAKGTMTANFTIVASKYCPGNRKGFVGMAGVGRDVGYEREYGNIRGEESQEESSAWFNNPLWVKKEHDDNRPSNLNTESSPEQQQQYQSPSYNDIQSSPTDQEASTSTTTNPNPLWVKKSSTETSQPTYERTQIGETTEFGGFSFDKQNERNEQKGAY